MYVYIYIYIYVHLDMYMCIHIYIYICIHMSHYVVVLNFACLLSISLSLYFLLLLVLHAGPVTYRRQTNIMHRPWRAMSHHAVPAALKRVWSRLV